MAPGGKIAARFDIGSVSPATSASLRGRIRHAFCVLLCLSALLTAGRSQDFDAQPLGAPSDTDPVSDADLVLPVERVIIATRPRLFYRLARVDGVLSSPGARQETTVQTASGTVHWTPAPNLAFQYTPAWIFYSNPAFEDNFAHQAVVAADLALSEWELRFSHHYLRTSFPLTETGQQTKLESHDSLLQAQHPFGERTTLELGLAQHLRFAKEFTDLAEWRTEDWLHYRISTRVTAAAGFAYGYTRLEDSPDMSYEQYRGRLDWHVANKVRVGLRAGFETRHTGGDALGNTTAPVYGALLAYHPFESTTLFVTGDRAAGASYFRNQLSRSTNWNATLQQRLLGKLHLTMTYAHRSAHYDSIQTAVLAPRSDRGESFESRLSAGIRSHGVVTVFYRYRSNHSTDPGFTTSGRMIGFELGYQF